MSEQRKNKIDRRKFLGIIGAGGVAATILAAFGAVGRYLFPQVFYEPSQQSRLGSPSDFAEGSVTFIPSAKVFLHHAEDGFFAISSTCTHLGCIISKNDSGFACPCHGSVFDKDGKVKGGPAPRALPWFELSLSPEGTLIVDRSRTVSLGTKLVV
ncbi:MAG: Rieske (2Fe-2S) protein [Myxococcota bacterium]